MIVILMGVSSSGKTVIGKELAKKVGWPFFDGDDFHSHENIKKMRAGIPLTDADRQPWLQSLAKLIREHLSNKSSMILACSALKESYRKILKVDQSCKIVYLKGSLELIQKRIEKRRGHFFDPKLLSSQFRDLEEPSDALIVDIDQSIDAIIKKISEELCL